MQLFEAKYQGSVLNNPMKFHHVNHLQKTTNSYTHLLLVWLICVTKHGSKRYQYPSFKKMTGVHRVQLPSHKDGFQSLPSLTIKRISNDHPW